MFTRYNVRYFIFLSLRFVLILANSADSDEMQHYAAFHLGLHFLQKNTLRVSRIHRFKLHDTRDFEKSFL